MSGEIELIKNPGRGGLTMVWRRIDTMPNFPFYNIHLGEAVQAGCNFNEASGIYASAVPKRSMEFADTVASKIGNTHVTMHADMIAGMQAVVMITDGQTLRNSGAVQSNPETLKLLQFDPYA